MALSHFVNVPLCLTPFFSPGASSVIEHLKAVMYVLYPSNHAQSSLMFDSKAGRDPREETFRCSTLGYTPGLTHKQNIRLESPERGKRSSLLRTFVNYWRKKSYNIGPWNVKVG